MGKKHQLKFKCLQPRVVRLFEQIRNSFHKKLKCLKVALSWFVMKFVKCFIDVQNFKRFD